MSENKPSLLESFLKNFTASLPKVSVIAKTNKSSAFYKRMAIIDAIPKQRLVFDSGKYGTYRRSKHGDLKTRIWV